MENCKQTDAAGTAVTQESRKLNECPTADTTAESKANADESDAADIYADVGFTQWAAHGEGGEAHVKQLTRQEQQSDLEQIHVVLHQVGGNGTASAAHRSPNGQATIQATTAGDAEQRLDVSEKCATARFPANATVDSDTYRANSSSAIDTKAATCCPETTMTTLQEAHSAARTPAPQAALRPEEQTVVASIDCIVQKPHRWHTVAVMQTAQSQNNVPDCSKQQLLPGEQQQQQQQGECWHTYAGSDLPSWLHDNEFLVAWHRPLVDSYVHCMRTAFRLHTETGNIWTHALGCVAVAVVAVVTIATLPGSAYDAAVFAFFLLTACGCFAASAAFHTFRCHSKWLARMLNKIDYCGIALLTVGSFVPWLYYSFYCDATARISYLSAVVVLGATAAGFYMWDRFGGPRCRVVRATAFVGVGLSAVIPAAHVTAEHGVAHALHHLSLDWLLIMAALYIGGAVVYATRIPERWLPGRFDLIGHSHQWLHVLVVAAVFVHLHGLRQLADYRLHTPCTSTEVDMPGLYAEGPGTSVTGS